MLRLVQFRLEEILVDLEETCMVNRRFQTSLDDRDRRSDTVTTVAFLKETRETGCFDIFLPIDQSATLRNFGYQGCLKILLNLAKL